MTAAAARMPLSRLAFIQPGHTLRNSISIERKGDIALIQLKDTNAHPLAHPESLAHISLPHEPVRHWLKEGDLIFRARGPTHNAWTVVGPEIRAICAAPQVRIRIRDRALLEPAYLEWFINLAVTQRKLAGFARCGSTPTVARRDLETLEIVVPDMERQREIIGAHAQLALNRELEAALAQKRFRDAESALLEYAGGG